VKTCKKLKDKYGLTYGKGRDRVRREKLDNPDKVKYYMYDAIKAVLPECKNPADLRFGLKKFGIELEYKLRRTTNEIEGGSFRYNDIAFKGSQIDRKFSYGNLKKEFEKNIQLLQERVKKDQQRQEIQALKAQQQAENKPKVRTIGGVELTPQQWQILENGDFIYLENMQKKDGSEKFSSYVFLNEEKSKAFSCRENPEEFVKYGQYEIRIRDKILIEKGYVTKAKVKWYSSGFAYPYLWKENKSDIEYKEAWRDPRISKKKKQNESQKEIQSQQPIRKRPRPKMR
jgi:hypothetical protein